MQNYGGLHYCRYLNVYLTYLIGLDECTFSLNDAISSLTMDNFFKSEHRSNKLSNQESSTKILNLMTPRARVVGLGMAIYSVLPLVIDKTNEVYSNCYIRKFKILSFMTTKAEVLIVLGRGYFTDKCICIILKSKEGFTKNV